MENWFLKGQQKDQQSITADWTSAHQSYIAGVTVREIKNVVKSTGYLTEIYRKDWALDDLPVEQVFQKVMYPGDMSAWHAHDVTTDRLFVSLGTIKVVLFDSRPESPTYGGINEFVLSDLRPQLIIVPPRVWHGVKNTGTNTAILLNLVDRAYQYESPDHWRLPVNTPEIPYQL